MYRKLFITILASLLCCYTALANPVIQSPWIKQIGKPPIIKIASCKSYNTCEQAVKNWCTGRHNRADGDGDGIPCENVCRTRAQVIEIMRRIGCNR